jgi:molybdopterin-guanine dinucleotide biosynthesis protein A
MSSLSAGRYEAVVLAGGTSRRMGGGDKTALSLDGRSLLDRALDSVAGAERVIVVGTPRPTPHVVLWTREDPEGGGPAAALAAGLALIAAPVVVALAADLPFVTAATVDRLRQAAEPAGAVLVDPDGVPQWLLGAWPTEVLRAALAGDQVGRSLRAALTPVGPALVSSQRDQPEWFDCDEPADLQAAKELLDERAGRLAR